MSTSLQALAGSSSVLPAIMSVAGVWALGVGTYLMRSLPMKFWRFFLARFTVSVYISTMGTANLAIAQAFFQWYMATKYAKSGRRFSFDASHQDRAPSTSKSHGQLGRSLFNPGLGTHFFMFEGRPAWFVRAKAGTAMSDTQEINIFFFGTDVTIAERFIEELKPKADDTVTKVYGIGKGRYSTPEWELLKLRPKRNLKSVIIRHDIKDAIIAQIEDFSKRREWYEERGITYKLSYIFHGQPGTGKSSFIFALASYFNRALYTINLNALDDLSFQLALDRVPEGAFIVVEDIDVGSATADREETVVEEMDGTEKTKEKKASKISMSTILNALDGVASLSGNVIMLTTNHLEHLDPALTRRGRIDHIIEIPAMGADDIFEYAQVVYGADIYDHKRLKPMTGSDIQALFLDNKDSFAGFLRDLTEVQERIE